MSGDIMELANLAAPAALTALGAYGGAVLLQAQEQAAGSTVNAGRRLLQRVFGTRTAEEENPEILVDLLQDPGDPDNLASLRRAIRKALESDRELVSWLRQQIDSFPQRAEAFGERSVSVGSNTGVISTGDNAQIAR